MCLSLRGVGFDGFRVVPLRANGGDGHRWGWDGNLEEGGELGTHIHGVTQRPALLQLLPLD